MNFLLPKVIDDHLVQIIIGSIIIGFATISIGIITELKTISYIGIIFFVAIPLILVLNESQSSNDKPKTEKVE